MNVKNVDLSKPVHQLLTLPAIWLFVAGIFLAGVRTELPTWLGVVTKAEAAENAKAIRQVDNKVDALAQQVKFNQAFQQVRSFQAEVNLLMDKPEDTQDYRIALRKVSAKLDLAKRYQECLVDHDAQHQAICDLMQKQLWQ